MGYLLDAGRMHNFDNLSINTLPIRAALITQLLANKRVVILFPVLTKLFYIKKKIEFRFLPFELLGIDRLFVAWTKSSYADCFSLTPKIL
jgi:hypothetical protein